MVNQKMLIGRVELPMSLEKRLARERTGDDQYLNIGTSIIRQTENQDEFKNTVAVH
jgi:hypothetical protein